MEPVRFGRARFFKNLREANKDLSRVVSTICFELYFTSTFMPSPFGLDGILFSKLPLTGWRPFRLRQLSFRLVVRIDFRPELQHMFFGKAAVLLNTRQFVDQLVHT